MTYAQRIQAQVDAIVHRAVLRGAAQRRREDPDDEHEEAESKFDADPTTRIMTVHRGDSGRAIHLRKFERESR